MASTAVLVQTPAWGTGCPPLGIAALKSYLEARGHRIRAVDLNLQFFHAASDALKEQWAPDRHQFWLDPDRVRGVLEGELGDYARFCVAQILESKPRVVGFTVLFSTEHSVLWLARKIKEADPRCLIVCGGPQAGREAAGERLLDSQVVDCVVLGEGEESLNELLEKAEAGEDLATCRGLLLRRNGRIVETAPRPLLPDLTALPPADFSDFFMNSYTHAGMIPVSLSRGCPNTCAYCSEVTYWQRFRVRKAESLLSELRLQRERIPGLDSVTFHDSLVNGHMGELLRFAQGLVDEGAPIDWHGQAVIRKEMTRGALDLLRKSGCRSLTYGLETGSFSLMLKMGKLLAKGSDPDRIVRDTREAGIDCGLFFMTGYPGETEADFQMTLDFVGRNKDWISFVSPSAGFCDFHPGTRGHAHPDDFGIELREGSAHWVSKDGSNTYLTRLERFERFLDFVHDLKVPCAYPHRRLHLRNTIIGNYHYVYGQFELAVPYLQKAVDEEPPDETNVQRLAECLARRRETAAHAS